MKRFAAMLVVLVLVLSMASAAWADATLDPGAGDVNFTVQNLDEVDDATVQADYIAQDGTIASTRTKTIGPLASDGFPASDSGLPDNWLGSVIVSADREIVAFAQMIWQGGSFGDGKTAGAYNGFTQGADTLYLPSLAARAGAQFSRISVQSTEAPSASEDVEFTITFYDRSGAQTAEITDTVFKGAQKTYDLSEPGSGGVPANFPTNWLGSAVIESTEGPLAAVATMHWQQYSAGYSAVTGGGTKVSLPSATRRIPNGTTWVQYTGVIVQNLDTAQEADVTVFWYDRNGNALHTFTDSIPANSSHGYNTRFPDTSDVPSDPADFAADLTNDWNGSVVISSTNGVEVVAVANLQWTVDAPSAAAASAYTSEAAGYETLYVPATFRRVSGANWIQYTGLIVQNVGMTACNNFTVSWVDRTSGNELISFQDSLAPNISHGYNTRQGAGGSDIPGTVDITDLGDDFRGAVTISAPAGCQLVGIHNTVWPSWSDSTTYSAFGK